MYFITPRTDGRNAAIFNDLMRLRFVHDKLIAFLPVLHDEVSKGVRCKGIMLCGYAETLFFRLSVDKA